MATSAGIAAAVALLACLGSFLATAHSSMTARAVHSVVVDWQVQVQPDARPTVAMDAVRATPGVQAALPVDFAHSTGFVATTGSSTQTTGPAVVLGVPPDYRRQFPGAIRTLVGTDNGVLIAQQTAANLHVAPGDAVQIGRAGLAPVDVVVAGVVDLPQADSLFQTVGAPVGAQPTAPPDNVLILTQPQWHSVFDEVSSVRPDLISTQIHTSLDHILPPDPASAYTQITAAAHNLEARSAGGAQVGDNLAAALDAARGDAAYANVLFLFLAAPSAVLAGLLTATVVAVGAPRRRREQALLRARGASPRQLISLAVSEAVVVGVLGSTAGLSIAAVVGLAAFGSAGSGATTVTAIGWAAASTGAGLAIAAATIVAPARHDLRASTVLSARSDVRRARAPMWARFGFDLLILGASGSLFWLARRGGYQIVLAPEGVPAISVSYWAFAAPALLWVGSALLVWRLSDLLLGRGRRWVSVAIRPIAGPLSGIVAHSLSRQRQVFATAIVMLTLSLVFAVSTATFNSTYRAQAEVDAQLTNGADVTVTQPPGATVSRDAAKDLAAIPGVRAVEPIQHRFAYIGADLQDLYGVNPVSITSVTALQDNYFRGGTSGQLMQQLASQPDSILVSAETVTDFQLVPGDTVKLRLQDARIHQLTTVTFHYIGIVTEFPTAPKDSFFVANASYVAHQTGSDVVGAFLVDTGGHDTATVADRIRSVVGTSATVTEISATRGTVGSSLTAVSLQGLTQIELAFGLGLSAAFGGLVLALGLAERRRSYAIVNALGATPRQLRSFVVAEAALLIICSLIAGVIASWALSQMLVTVLKGVFDPPPTALSVPWPYLAVTIATVIVAIGAVSATTTHLARRSPLTVLNDL